MPKNKVMTLTLELRLTICDAIIDGLSHDAICRRLLDAGLEPDAIPSEDSIRGYQDGPEYQDQYQARLLAYRRAHGQTPSADPDTDWAAAFDRELLACSTERLRQGQPDDATLLHLLRYAARRQIAALGSERVAELRAQRLRQEADDERSRAQAAAALQEETARTNVTYFRHQRQGDWCAPWEGMLSREVLGVGTPMEIDRLLDYAIDWFYAASSLENLRGKGTVSDAKLDILSQVMQSCQTGAAILIARLQERLPRPVEIPGGTELPDRLSPEFAIVRLRQGRQAAELEADDADFESYAAIFSAAATRTALDALADLPANPPDKTGQNRAKPDLAIVARR